MFSKFLAALASSVVLVSSAQAAFITIDEAGMDAVFLKLVLGIRKLISASVRQRM